MKRALTALLVPLLIWAGSGIASAAPRLYANASEIIAMTLILDPHQSVTWIQSMAGTGEPATTYGKSYPWYNAVYLRGDALPLASYKHIIAHEWGHIAQYRYAAGSDVTQWQPLIDRLNRYNGGSSGTTGLEHEADCIAERLGYGPGCAGVPFMLYAHAQSLALQINSASHQ